MKTLFTAVMLLFCIVERMQARLGETAAQLGDRFATVISSDEYESGKLAETQEIEGIELQEDDLKGTRCYKEDDIAIKVMFLNETSQYEQYKKFGVNRMDLSLSDTELKTLLDANSQNKIWKKVNNDQMAAVRTWELFGDDGSVSAYAIYEGGILTVQTADFKAAQEKLQSEKQDKGF